MKSFYNRITSRIPGFVQKQHAWLAFAMLAVMGLLGFGSLLGNSAIVDEVAHISAGYSYLHFGDYRLNPEHPPLMKDLAALPLQFMNLRFPDDQTAWTTKANGQWDTGWNFLYYMGNNADRILFWARLPILLLALGFGAALYVIVRRRWGTETGLLALFFYCLSPNLLAHSVVVTTDLGASVFMFLALVGFAHYIDKPSWANLGWLSLALMVAQLAKFSAFLLYPFLAVLSLILVLVRRSPADIWSRFKIYVGGMAAASGLSVAGVWLVYSVQVARMPIEVQDRLISGVLWSPRVKWIGQWLLSFNHWPLMKPIVHYLLGMTMVYARVNGGNVTYFNGAITNQSFHTYFPELFLFKTQLALLILMIVTAGYTLWRSMGRKHKGGMLRLAEHLSSHVLEWTLGLFAAFYFAVSVAGNLNLGIRHILPIYVPIFVLVAVGTVKTVRGLAARGWAKPAGVGLAALLVWYGGSTVVAYPNYLSYFNELIGGGANAGQYFSDSSVDWGQDLKRLKVYVDAHPEIAHIAVDYFGGGVPEYYFCNHRPDAEALNLVSEDQYDCSSSVYEPWHAQNGLYSGQYIAVSETFLENDRYYAAYYNRPGYDYLRALKPVAKIGNSIYVFKLR